MEDPNGPQRRRSLKRTFDQISSSPPPQPAWTTRFADAVQNSSAPSYFCPLHDASLTDPDTAAAESNAAATASNAAATVPTQPVSAPEPVSTPTATASEATMATEAAMPRFVGDGIDTRRPVMAASPVIDLTGSDSPEQTRSPQTVPVAGRSFPGGLPPRLNREPSVIDLDTYNFESNSERATPPVDLTGPNPIDLEEGDDDDDDEVQFISENRRPFPQPPPPHPHRPPGLDMPSLPRNLLHRAHWGVTAGGARREMMSRARLAEAQRAQRRRLDRLERSFQRHEAEFGSMRQTSRRAHNRPAAEVRPVEPPATSLYNSISSLFFPTNLPSLNFRSSNIYNLLDSTAATLRLPGEINYNERAFDPATAMSDTLPRPTYEAPPPVPEGFTRDPTGADELVCPNCDHTLATGEGLDKQVWAIRECGHVYCGFCASTRPSGRIKPKNKPSLEAKPRQQEWLTQCEVEGCTSKTNNKGRMFQVYANVD